MLMILYSVFMISIFGFEVCTKILMVYSSGL